MRFLFFIIGFSICFTSIAQNKLTAYTKVDSSNFGKIYPYALRGDMQAVFEMLEMAEDRTLTSKQRDKKQQFYQRFLYQTEGFDYQTSDAEIIDMFKRFQNYWRSVMIENVPQNLADSLFRDEMNYFLKKYFKPDLSIEEIDESYYGLFQDFFESKNMHGIAMGKTGHLYDLYLWKNQKEVDYQIELPEGQSFTVSVVLMRNFISNGWSHYTTFGRSYSGGWATSDKLFCVEEAYGPKDEEEYLISYVSHEGQHFADYQSFPKLKQADLEYRAKLTELSLAKETTYKIINKFITNSKNDKSYAHPYANYMVIKFLSQEIFDTDFEMDMEKWKQASINEINKVALKLLKAHTEQLNTLGAKSIEAYITTL